MLGFILGDMYGRWPLLTPPPRLGKHFPLPAGYQCYGRVSAAMMTIDTLLATPYPQKLYRDLVYGHVVERQRRLFAEHIVLARPAQGEELERSIEPLHRAVIYQHGSPRGAAGDVGRDCPVNRPPS